MSRKSVERHKVHVIKRMHLGHVPVFIQLAHKALEKGQVTGSVDTEGVHTFTISKDLLGICVSDPDIIEHIEHIELTYQKGA